MTTILINFRYSYFRGGGQLKRKLGAERAGAEGAGAGAGAGSKGKGAGNKGGGAGAGRQ